MLSLLHLLRGQSILDSQGELFPPDSPPRVGTEYRQRDLQGKAKKSSISRLFSRNKKKDTQEAAPIPWNLVPLDLPPVVSGRRARQRKLSN